MSTIATFKKLAARDLAALLLCLLSWSLYLPLHAQGGWTATLIALPTAALTVLVGFLGHEWGHLLGALGARAAVYAPRTLTGLFLFHFDTRLNDRQQFLAMSAGGFIFSIIFMATLIVLLPLHSLAGGLAVGVAAIGLVATALTEVPLAWRVANGADLPTGPVYEPIAEA